MSASVETEEDSLPSTVGMLAFLGSEEEGDSYPQMVSLDEAVAALEEAGSATPGGDGVLVGTVEEEPWVLNRADMRSALDKTVDRSLWNDDVSLLKAFYQV
jgi:hypothetical protein